MNAAFLRVAGLALACSLASAQTRPASLAGELRQLEHSLSPQTASEIRAALPSAWQVQTPEGDYAIATAPLRGLLDRHAASVNRLRGPSERALVDAKSWLDHLASQLNSYAGAVPQATATRAALEHILAQPEFAGAAPPNAWERFWTRVYAQLAAWLNRVFAFSGGYATATPILFWLALAGAVALIAFFLFRLWARDRYRFQLSGSPLPLPIRNSRTWLLSARAAAATGDLRTAIQCAYWAGIARLQESQALPQSATFTPREYLRLLAAPAENVAALPALRTLTANLERFWYGRATASPDDFKLSLSSLEALGCQVD